MNSAGSLTARSRPGAGWCAKTTFRPTEARRTGAAAARPALRAEQKARPAQPCVRIAAPGAGAHPAVAQRREGGTMDRLTLAVVSRNYFNMPAWIAQHAGLFAAEGLEV